MRWRWFKIGDRPETAREFYAPDLLQAFHQARIDGFGSLTLRCYGSRER